MAFTEQIVEVSALAAADYSTTGQYLGVKLTSTANTVELADTNGEQIYGVLQNDPASGETARVAIGGICKAEAGAAIAVGALVAVDTDGQFITAATADTAVGFARSAAGAAGEVFSLDFRTYLGVVA